MRAIPYPNPLRLGRVCNKAAAVADLAEAYPLSIFPDTIGIMEEGRENLLVYARAIFNAFGPRNALS